MGNFVPIMDTSVITGDYFLRIAFNIDFFEFFYLKFQQLVQCFVNEENNFLFSRRKNVFANISPISKYRIKVHFILY